MLINIHESLDCIMILWITSYPCSVVVQCHKYDSLDCRIIHYFILGKLAHCQWGFQPDSHLLIRGEVLHFQSSSYHKECTVHKRQRRCGTNIQTANPNYSMMHIAIVPDGVLTA